MMNKELERNIQNMINYIDVLAPEVRVEHIPAIYGDEDANLKVYPPLTWNEEQCDELEDQIAEHVVDTLVDAGYLILVGVYTPEEQVAKMRHKLALAQRQQAQANQFLTQAAALGLA